MVLDLAQNVFKSTVRCAVVCALSAGCSKTVVLGSECPAQEGPCGQDTFLPQPEASAEPFGPDSAPVGLDANGFPAGPRAPDDGGSHLDVAPPSDSGGPSDAGIGQTTDAAEPAEAGAPDATSSGLLQNPSFELQANPNFGVIENQFGADVLVSDLAGYVPRAGEFFANIDPWFACWVGAQVHSDLGGPAGGLVATQGEALISTGYGAFVWLPGLFQILEGEPLEAGRSYSFMLDVLNSGTGRSALRLGATNIPCTAPEVYDETPELTNRNAWQSYCLTFRPTRPLGTIALVPFDVADGGVGEVSFDNLREVDSCPQ